MKSIDGAVQTKHESEQRAATPRGGWLAAAAETPHLTNLKTPRTIVATSETVTKRGGVSINFSSYS